MAGILSKCRGEMSESHLLLEVHIGRMEAGDVSNALLLESTRPVSLTIHLPNKALGERIQVVLVYTVHTEDELYRQLWRSTRVRVKCAWTRKQTRKPTSPWRSRQVWHPVCFERYQDALNHDDASKIQDTW
jgi:hypothetical protein